MNNCLTNALTIARNVIVIGMGDTAPFVKIALTQIDEAFVEWSTLNELKMQGHNQVNSESPSLALLTEADIHNILRGTGFVTNGQAADCAELVFNAINAAANPVTDECSVLRIRMTEHNQTVVESEDSSTNEKFEIWFKNTFHPDLVTSSLKSAIWSAFVIDALERERDALKLLSVKNILLDIVPGDGSGQEVYAKSTDQVIELLTNLSEKIDLLEQERDALKAQLAAKPPAVFKGWHNGQEVYTSPITSAADWRDNGEVDPHEGSYNCERAELPLGHLTDDALANAVFLNGDQPLDIQRAISKDPTYTSPVAYLTAAKDRIRWLSRKLCSSQEAFQNLNGALVNFKDIEWPDYHAQGMGCGLEDRNITDRYETMEYGWNKCLDRCQEAIPTILVDLAVNTAGVTTGRT